MAHRRREIQTGDQFSFCQPNQRASADLNPSDEIEYGTWAERIKGGYGYFGKSGDPKLGAWQRRTPPDHHDEDDFRWLAREEDDDSDVPSLPLWKKPGSPVTRSGETSPIHHHHHHGDKDEFIYPTPRAQAIARYRQEMLDLVRDMPETAYELSLRDLVESPRIANLKPSELPKTEEEEEKDRKERTKKGARRMSRSESMETEGLLLKMFFPNSLTGGRKSFVGSGARAKVSPKPQLVEGEKGGLEKRTERDWWKKNTSSEKGSSSSSSSNSNSSSSNSNSSNGSRKMSGCYSFLRTNRNRGSED